MSNYTKTCTRGFAITWKNVMLVKLSRITRVALFYFSLSVSSMWNVFTNVLYEWPWSNMKVFPDFSYTVKLYTAEWFVLSTLLILIFYLRQLLTL